MAKLTEEQEAQAARCRETMRSEFLLNCVFERVPVYELEHHLARELLEYRSREKQRGQDDLDFFEGFALLFRRAMKNVSTEEKQRLTQLSLQIRDLYSKAHKLNERSQRMMKLSSH